MLTNTGSSGINPGESNAITKEPTISVVIRTYNRANLLKFAIDSVLQQTLLPTEVIVVDDASTDETPAIMQCYTREYSCVRYKRLDQNQGMDVTKKIGVDFSQSDYVAFLDSDDIWLPSHLEKCMQVLRQNPQNVMVFSRYGLINEQGECLTPEMKEDSLRVPPITSLLFKRVIVQPSRSVFRRKAILEVGGIPPCGIVGDWVLNVLIAARFPEGVIQLPQSTMRFRIHGSQSYSRPGEVLESQLNGTEFIFEHLPKEWSRFRSRVIAINQLHSAVFFWQAGLSKGAWKCLIDALKVDPTCVTLRDYYAALARIMIPPKLGVILRKRKWSLKANK